MDILSIATSVASQGSYAVLSFAVGYLNYFRAHCIYLLGGLSQAGRELRYFPESRP